MKKLRLSATAAVLFGILITLNGCAINRHLYYAFTPDNKDIIKNVFTSGIVAQYAGNGAYVITKATSNPNEFYLEGHGQGLSFGSSTVKVTPANKGTEIRIKVKSWFLTDEPMLSTAFLDEITSRLFAANGYHPAEKQAK